jgi:hypothetical protein
MDYELLNEVIEQNMKNRKNTTDYSLIEYVFNRAVGQISIPNRNITEMKTKLTQEQVMKIGLRFFESLDTEIYQRVKDIVEGKTPLEFRIYDIKEITDFTEMEDEEFARYEEIPKYRETDKRAVIYIPLNGTTKDLYTFVHEISHTFDMQNNYSSVQNLLQEVTPRSFESMLSAFLRANTTDKNRIISRYKK